MNHSLRVLVSGASGFLGRALTEDLVLAGFTVTGVSRRQRTNGQGIRWVTCDITDEAALGSLVDSHDVVVNAAARTWSTHEVQDPADYYRINRDAAVALFRAAQRANVRAFIQISSTGVYGRGEGTFGENSPCRPRNAYELSKFEAEQRLGECALDGSTRLVIVRPSNVFGEGHPRKKLLTWLRAVKRGHVVLASDSNTRWVNYVYLRDVTQAICQLVRTVTVDRVAPVPDVITLNDPATLRQFFEESARALGVSQRALALPASLLMLIGGACDAFAFAIRRPLPMTCDKARELTNRQVFSAERASRTLPGFPWLGLREGLRKTGDYYRAQGEL